MERERQRAVCGTGEDNKKRDAIQKEYARLGDDKIRGVR